MKNKHAGKILKRIVSQTGLTNESICKKMDVTEDTIYRWQINGVPDKKIPFLANCLNLEERIFQDDSMLDSEIIKILKRTFFPENRIPTTEEQCNKKIDHSPINGLMSFENVLNKLGISEPKFIFQLMRQGLIPYTKTKELIPCPSEHHEYWIKLEHRNQIERIVSKYNPLPSYSMTFSESLDNLFPDTQSFDGPVIKENVLERFKTVIFEFFKIINIISKKKNNGAQNEMSWKNLMPLTAKDEQRISDLHNFIIRGKEFRNIKKLIKNQFDDEIADSILKKSMQGNSISIFTLYKEIIIEHHNQISRDLDKIGEYDPNGKLWKYFVIPLNETEQLKILRELKDCYFDNKKIGEMTNQT